MPLNNKIIFLSFLISINIFSIKNISLPIYIDPEKQFYYYTKLFYGEEKAPQALSLDTTSSIITSPCNLCKTCGYHSNEWYNMTNKEDQILNCNSSICGSLSGNCLNNQCSYKYDYYEDAYVKGIYVNEEIFFDYNSLQSYNITIGCTLNETNYIIAQDSDGIMGLNNDENSFINLLYKSKIIKNNIFTIFLRQDNSGYFSIGRINRKYHSSKIINYVPFFIDEEKYYKLEINSFEINNQKINNIYSAIIDTTATLTSFPKDIFDLIVKEFDKKCTEDLCGKLIKNRHFGVCAFFNYENEMMTKIKNWLKITINFNKYNYEWDPTNYWVNITTEHTFRACLGFESTKEKVITLGTTFMHGYDVIFNRDKNKIGFVKVDPNQEFIFNNSIHDFKEEEMVDNDSYNFKEEEMINNDSNKFINTSLYNNLRVNKKAKIIKFSLIFSIFIISFIIIIISINIFGQKYNKKRKRYKKNIYINKMNKKSKYRDKEEIHFLYK